MLSPARLATCLSGESPKQLHLKPRHCAPRVNRPKSVPNAGHCLAPEVPFAQLAVHDSEALTETGCHSVSETEGIDDR